MLRVIESLIYVLSMELKDIVFKGTLSFVSVINPKELKMKDSLFVFYYVSFLKISLLNDESRLYKYIEACCEIYLKFASLYNIDGDHC